MLPPSALPWPPMYLVKALTTSAALTVFGRNRYGDVIVLSTTYTMPRAAQSSPIRARSATCVRGLAIVSTNTMRVCGVNAASTASTLVASTKLTRSPWVASVLNMLFVLPNRNALETTWSSSRSSASRMAPIAAMPVLKQTVATPSSMRFTFSSSAAVVGLPCRP
jgi:hypothetical protein